MAKQRPPAAPKAQAPSKSEPYPSNWARLSQQERQSWLQTNRPGRQTGAVGPAAAPAAPGSSAAPAAQPNSPAAPPEGAVPVKIRVALYSIQVGDRGAIECPARDLGETLAAEMRAYEDAQGQPAEGEEGDEEDQDDF